MARCVGLEELFAGRHFDRESIVLCVRWFKLSFRDLVEMMAERGLSVGYTIMLRSLSAAGTASRRRREVRGVWTRHT
jgi:transposase-like protein